MSIERDPITNMDVISFEREEIILNEDRYPVAFAAFTRVEDGTSAPNKILIFPLYVSDVYQNICVVSGYCMKYICTDWDFDDFLDLIKIDYEFMDDIGLNARCIDLDFGDTQERIGKIYESNNSFVSIYDQDNHHYEISSSRKYLESCIKEYIMKDKSKDSFPVASFVIEDDNEPKLEKVLFRIIEHKLDIV